MTSVVDAFVGLGSNLDDPRERVLEAVSALAGLPGVTLYARSGLYGSRPMGPADQPDYVNAVAWLRTDVHPHALLDLLQMLETDAGRSRTGQRWGPRRLDLDLLVYGDERLGDGRLTLPHPGIGERAFVLLPLAEIAPDLDIPGLGSARVLADRIDRADIWALEEDGR